MMIKRSVLFLLFWFVTFTSVAQLNVQIKGGDVGICANEVLTLQDSVVSGNATSYEWISSVAVFSSTSSRSTTATISGSGEIILKTSNSSESYYDTIQITQVAVPDIELGPDESVCCDAGLYSLNFKLVEPAGLPATGGWSSTEFPELVKNNLFDIDSACNYILNGFPYKDFSVVYTYQEPSTLCTNSDSLVITVNRNPNLILQDGDYCQDAGSVDLDDDIIISPSNTALGKPSWECIECNGNDFSRMLENRGPDLSPDYWLNVSETSYTIQNPDKDTITLEFEYQNQYGCTSVDTTYVRVWRVPEVKFSGNRDLCFDEGEISLDSLTGVNISRGTWSCYDSIGYFGCSTFSSILGDVIDTRSTPGDGKYSWILRYYHDASGCPSQAFIPITINPLPPLSIATHNYIEFCEGDRSIELEANPIGGVWTNLKDPASITNGNQYNPSTAQVFNMYTSVQYDFTNPLTGCRNVDSILVRTDRQPRILPIQDTNFCYSQVGQKRSLNFELEATDASFIGWTPAAIFGNNDRVSLSQYSSSKPEVATFTPNGVNDTFRIITFASPNNGSACLDVSDAFDVIGYFDSSCVLSARNIELDKIKIYPNPSKGRFTIEASPNYTVEIINSLGQRIPFERIGESVQVDYKGLIFIRLIDENGNFSESKKVYIY